MMISNANENSTAQLLPRPSFMALMVAALETKDFQFARQAGLSWLANFPGDLQVNVLYAKALIALNRQELAVTQLMNVINYDIEYIDALTLLNSLVQDDQRIAQEVQADVAYLTKQKIVSKLTASWLNDLNYARNAYETLDYKQAEKYILNVMAKNPQTPLPAIEHLKIVQAQQNTSLLSTLSSIYLKRWPNSNQIRIFAALSQMETGNDVAAIDNLQWSAAHDTSGQVITRMLGKNHPYKPLWPEKMEIYLELPVPATVAAELGWNKLGNGVRITNTKSSESAPVFNTTPIKVHNSPKKNHQDETGQAKPVEDLLESFTISEHGLPPQDQEENIKVLDEIQQEFDRMAKSMKKQSPINTEGNFPVYVILTSKTALARKYGENTAGVILQDLQELADKITDLPNWNSVLFCPDDPEITSALKMPPQLAIDAWKIKLSLVDLDKALSTRGEMIGAVLIIGGNAIIPFHQLPNPTDDADQFVLSDNPYATNDENYFVPQWPVGRIPDEDGQDATFLIEQIRYINNEYAYKLKSKKLISSSSWLSAFFSAIGNVFVSLKNALSKPKNFGYAAEAWQKPSGIVFNTIGNGKNLLLSPPIDHTRSPLKNNGNEKCAYFNLHGLQESGEWFGQKDFTKDSAAVDYPVALTPNQLKDDGTPPEFVFSEACYGAWINDKQADESIALKFLQIGTRSMVGSTGIAFGSVQSPLIAADLLAQEYWKQLLAGQTSGYALMRAKLNLARVMSERQGYLDGEDQKTILSFVLFGDPLSHLNDLKHVAKPLYRPKAQPKMKTISDSREEIVNDISEIPTEILTEIKSVVKNYLPGLENAQLNLNPQLSNFSLSLEGSSRRKQKKYSVNESQRYVVTLKKSYEGEQYKHTQFARMTFDRTGHMVKLSVSK